MTTTNKTKLMEAALKAWHENSYLARNCDAPTLAQVEGTTSHRQLSAIVDKMVEMIGDKQQSTIFATTDRCPTLADANKNGRVHAYHSRDGWLTPMWTMVTAESNYTHWYCTPLAPLSPFERALAHFDKSIEGCNEKPSREVLLKFWQEAQAATKGEVC